MVFYVINEEVVLLVNPDKPSQAMLFSGDDMNKGSYLWFLVFNGHGCINYLL